MKIELIKQFFDDGDCSYKYKPIEWCCDEIESNPLINLVHEYTYRNNSFDDDNTLKPSFTLVHSETISSWGDEWEEDTYYKINFCPFCGKPIELVVIGEEDASEIFAKLRNQRDIMWKKHNKTDSKKKERELGEIVRDLDNKINYFYSLSEYDDSWKEW